MRRHKREPEKIGDKQQTETKIVATWKGQPCIIDDDGVWCYNRFGHTHIHLMLRSQLEEHLSEMVKNKIDEYRSIDTKIYIIG